MRAAPPCTALVDRAIGLQAAVYGVYALSGGLLAHGMLAWATALDLAGTGVESRAWGLLAIGLAAAAAAACAWRWGVKPLRRHTGRRPALRWTGQAWQLLPTPEAPAEAAQAVTELTLAIDGGAWLLLCARSGPGRPAWLLLRLRSAGPAAWAPLRQALMAHAGVTLAPQSAPGGGG